jgi:hypothetical protein
MTKAARQARTPSMGLAAGPLPAERADSPVPPAGGLLISVCGEKDDRNPWKAWTARPNGLITIPVGTSGREQRLLDNRLKPVQTFTSRPFRDVRTRRARRRV